MDWSKVAEILAMALGAIDTIVSRVRNKGGGRIEAAADALTVIGTIVDTVKAGDLDDLDLDGVKRELQSLLDSLELNDAAADAAVADKFDRSDSDA